MRAVSTGARDWKSGNVQRRLRNQFNVVTLRRMDADGLLVLGGISSPQPHEAKQCGSWFIAGEGKQQGANMKTRIPIYLAAMTFLIPLTLSMALSAQDPPEPRHYRVMDLGTLGGPVSGGNTINNRGWVTGFSTESGGVPLATLWVDGLQLSLGTLGGPGSDVAWPVKNNFGLISGTSENGMHDPLNETFSCPAFGLVSGNSCVAFAWQHGTMTELPGLGGNNSIGAGDNNRAQIVGWAENGVQDPTCAPPSAAATQFLQFEATLWERERRGTWQVHELPPYPGDPDGAATAINDFGRAVGISGQCDVAIGAFTAIHALLWEDGKPIDLGNLGGHGWNTPAAINNRGVIAGFANGPNDVVGGQLQFRWLAFRWTKEHGMQSLGTLPGDAMNDENQIVGVSYADYLFGNPRAFIYQNGTMTALNSLIGSASAKWDVSSTSGINDRGEIAAQANVVSNGVVTSAAHAVLLIPSDSDDAVAYGEIQNSIIPDDVRKEMREHVNVGHFHLRVEPR
jgi:probable HAF family extracellular repeat protein